MNYKNWMLGTFGLSLFLCSCQGVSNNKHTTGIDPLSTNIDTTVRPQDDYFSYANGAWIKKNAIPDEYSSTGIARLVIDDLQGRLRTINEDAVKKPEGKVGRQIADFWQSGMDSTKLNQEGIKPLAGLMTQVDSLSDIPGLIQLCAGLHKMGIEVLLSVGVLQDAKNSDAMALYLFQGGIGLPDRDYYFNTDEQTQKVRAAYPKHIAQMFSLAGLYKGEEAAYAEKVLAIETNLAKSSRKLEALRDPYANYNKYGVASLKMKLTPQIDWQSFNHNIGINQLDSVIVGQPEFLKTLDAALKSMPLAEWKAYLKWHILSAYAPYLSDALVTENFAFYAQTLGGAKKQLPRWKKVLDAEEEAVGEALGQLFVKEYFNATAKKRYEDMVEDIRAALKNRIEHLEWMSPTTKEKALVKLAKMSKKVGYPDKWKDFSAMDIKAQSYAQNIMAARLWWHNYSINKLGKPVDRSEWNMTPQTYNAYYNPSNNEIVLPAGIFTVPGKRDEELDDAFVYGYAGASTIGHEITHGFDDEGRQFDEKGNLQNWWTKEDEANFTQRAEVMVKQFDAYEPLPGKHINGKATLGENIADLGGVLLGWDAFLKTEQYTKGKKLNGESPAERFFLGYAHGWLYNMRPEELARRLVTDVHSPAKYRVNGPFSNVAAFYETYKIQPTDKMYIPEASRVKIW
ncbi:M13 family peptidase [Taibaiella sp. KBW10]|uniref:M13 family metallopeptidase n=1 Tax=Taibaiella sp. KBW10 TaxID=2153357 RepID=UPI000F5B2857|nr:M13 family metallopeptidase [Taibaiella sp. KBW10]RQO31848.1 M13 family peptidase [Taibaiella sp. KBW10]